jgi:amino acid permease
MSKKMMRKETREQKIIYGAFLISLSIVIVAIITVMTFSLYKNKKTTNIFEEKSKDITQIAGALEKYKEGRGSYPSPDGAIGILAGK